MDYSAIQLFVTRVRQIHPGYKLQEDEVVETARICQLVQGLPLAIILAAGWIEVLSLAEIRAEMASNLDFLETEIRDVPDRHRSMRSVFSSSWRYLDPDEQDCFSKLSVFRGGFTRQAAESVAGAQLRTLRRLVHKSFIVYNKQGRYEIHELLRQYGNEELIASGQEEVTRQAHSDTILQQLKLAEADLRGRDQARALNEIAADLENIRTAWDWALAHKDAESIWAAAESLHLFFDMRTRYLEGIEFFQRAKTALSQGPNAPANLVWAKILARLSFMRCVTNILGPDLETAIATCLQIAEDHDDQPEIAFCLFNSRLLLDLLKAGSVGCAHLPG